MLYRADAPRWGHGDLSQIREMKYNRYKTAAARRWDSWLLERFLKASISRIFQYRPITKKKSSKTSSINCSLRERHAMIHYVQLIMWIFHSANDNNSNKAYGHRSQTFCRGGRWEKSWGSSDKWPASQQTLRPRIVSV